MRHSALVRLALLATVVLWPALPAAGQVEARIRRVGLFEGGDPIVRAGAQAALIVDLRWSANTPFDGELRVHRQDRDGDVIISVQRVQLPPDNEWHPYEVYFTPHAVNNTDTVTVRLFGPDGALVSVRKDTGEDAKELHSPFYTSLSPEELLILDLTFPRKLPHAAWLDERRYAPAGDKAFSRHVRSMSPSDLPTRWQGLEMVDAIIWDDADPSALGVQQAQALVEWVENGGRLLITAGRNWQLLAQSPLADILPVKLTGVEPVNELDEFLALVKSESYEKKLEKHFFSNPVTRCVMQPVSSKVIPIPARFAGADPIAYRRLLRRGSVTFCGASLEQLLPAPKRLRQVADDTSASSGPDRQDPFLIAVERVLGATMLGLPAPREWQETTVWSAPLSTANLFDLVRRAIDFGALSTAFLLFAVLFTIAYGLLSLGGTWWYLRRKNLPQHTWSAFCAVSLLGIVVGTGMVITLRGFSTQVWQTGVIDAREGEDYGQGIALFGVKTPDHTMLDLRMPVGYDDAEDRRSYGVLRPSPRIVGGMEMTDDTFVAPERYRSERDATWLSNVPVRATLKEFQGYWHGPIGGTINARFVVPRRGDDESSKRDWFGKGSYLRNNLGFPLVDCYIIETRDETAAESPNLLTRCLRLGTLDRDAALDDLMLEDRLYHEPAAAPGSPRKPLGTGDLLLTKVAEGWRRGIGGLSFGGAAAQPASLRGGADSAALLLLSTYELLRTDREGIQHTTRGPGRSLNCSQLVTAKTALLIGFSTEPRGPVLEIDRVKYKPTRSFTMYRFVIPVERE